MSEKKQKHIGWVGHRGLPTEYPENTLEGVLAACKAGASGVEFDVQLTADGEPVLMHDDNILRTSGIDRRIGSLTLKDLDFITVGEPSRFGNQYAKVGVAHCADVAAALKAYPNVTVFVELKEESLARFSCEDFVQRVWQAIEPIRYQCVIISFSLNIVREVQRCGYCPVGWVLTAYDDVSLVEVNTQLVDYLICNYKKMALAKSAPWDGSWQWFIYDVVDEAVMRQCLMRGIYWLETWDLNRAKQFNKSANIHIENTPKD